ncbi:MAG: SDR family NAD(P)-dependent oxidoreductase [Spirochaetaceae bacterium]
MTGASSGIGLELSRTLASERFDLVLVARRAEQLEALASELRRRHAVDVLVIPTDLARRSAATDVHRTVTAAGYEVEVLVNNAGFATYGAFHQAELSRELAMIEVNVAALVELTHLFLPAMVDRGFGRIMNVASTAAFQPGPLMAGYFATKAFVLHFSEAVAAELEGTGVTVTALCPGPTETAFQPRAGMEQARLLRYGTMSAREVAKFGYRALLAGKRVAVPGIANRLGTLAPRLLPRSLLTRIVRHLQAPVTDTDKS